MTKAPPSRTLFLDFDGVLSNEKFLRTQQNHGGADNQALFDPKNIQALNELCASGMFSNIVLTSTWRVGREMETLRHMLKENQFEFAHLIAGGTPVMGHAYENRENEIREWLKLHPKTEFIVLDDWDFTKSFGDNAFCIPSTTGLTIELVARILTSL